MTDPSGANLNRARLHRLLAAVGSAPARIEPTGEVEVYDWRDPHYFNEDQRNRLAALMSQVAAVLSERCAHFFNSEFNVVPASITQHFANDVNHHIDLERSFSLSFGPDAKPPCGFLAIGAEAAMNWVTQLLGDSESEQNPDRVLSSLEQSLLSNLVGAMAESFLGSLKPHQNLKPAEEVVRGSVATAFEPTDPICRIVFQIGKADAEPGHEVTFVCCGKYHSLNKAFWLLCRVSCGLRRNRRCCVLCPNICPHVCYEFTFVRICLVFATINSLHSITSPGFINVFVMC